MKVITFIYFDGAHALDVAQASDKLHTDTKYGVRMLSHYVFLGEAFPGAPKDRMVSMSIAEVDNEVALMQAETLILGAGATVFHHQTAAEIEPGKAAKFNTDNPPPPGL